MRLSRRSITSRMILLLCDLLKTLHLLPVRDHFPLSSTGLQEQQLWFNPYVMQCWGTPNAEHTRPHLPHRRSLLCSASCLELHALASISHRCACHVRGEQTIR